MPYLNNTEQKAQKNETTLKNLINEIEHLHLETQKLFSDLNICPDQFAAHIENPENFTQAEWDRLQEHKKKLDQKLDLSSNPVADPLKTRKALSDLHNSRNWLFVR
jgi:hypothetical protein